MSGNKNGEVTPLSHNKGKLTHAERRNQRWDKIKSDAVRIYMDEDSDLKTTMGLIRDMYAFKAGYVRYFDIYTQKG
jgi:hypothetical protein